MDINNKVYIVVQKYQISASLTIYDICSLKCTVEGSIRYPPIVVYTQILGVVYKIFEAHRGG